MAVRAPITWISMTSSSTVNTSSSSCNRGVIIVKAQVLGPSFFGNGGNFCQHYFFWRIGFVFAVKYAIGTDPFHFSPCTITSLSICNPDA